MFFDEDNEMNEIEDMDRKLREKAMNEFIQGCHQAYEILETQGKEALSQAELPSIKKAINRMTTYFIMQEDYEKCGFLKRFVNENIPDFEITLDETVQNDLNL